MDTTTISSNASTSNGSWKYNNSSTMGPWRHTDWWEEEKDYWHDITTGKPTIPASDDTIKLDDDELKKILDKIFEGMERNKEEEEEIHEFSNEELMEAFATIAGALKDLKLDPKELVNLNEALNILFERLKETMLCSNLPY